MKRFALLGILTALLTSSTLSAAAATYVQVSGQLTNNQGTPMGGAPSIVVATYPGSQVTGQIDSTGHYSVNVPMNVDTDLTFVVYEPGYGEDNGSGSPKKSDTQ